MQTRGRCACGNVRFEIDGEPLHQFYCHCRSCQTAHAAPFLAAALFPAAAVHYTGDTRTVTVTQRPDATPRLICPRCGTKVSNLPAPSLRTLFPMLCEARDWFVPELHMQSGDRCVDIHDDLPK